MDIKDYSKTKIEKNKNPQTDEMSQKSVNGNYSDLVQEFMKRYGKMDEKQMMDELFKLVQEKKKDGTFDIKQIQEISQTVRPFLSFEQQEYMEELIKKIS